MSRDAQDAADAVGVGCGGSGMTCRCRRCMCYHRHGTARAWLTLLLTLLLLRLLLLMRVLRLLRRLVPHDPANNRSGASYSKIVMSLRETRLSLSLFLSRLKIRIDYAG